MYLRITKGRQKAYLVIVEGYREDGKVKQRTICNLGPVDDPDQKDNLLRLGSKLLQHFKASAVIDGSEIQEKSRVNWGAATIVNTLWKRYSLSQLFSDKIYKNRKIQYDLESAIKLMLAGRLCKPSSKLALYENKDYYADFHDLSLVNLYRAIDELHNYREEINHHLFKVQSAISGKAHITFFDVTTLYFESQKADDLRKFGFSKDCKFNDVQITLSLLTNEQGFPIACEVFRGNMYEGHTMLGSILLLKEKYKLEKAIIVADRGMYNSDNLQAIKSAGFEYIVGAKLRNSSKAVREAVFVEDDYCHNITNEGYKF